MRQNQKLIALLEIQWLIVHKTRIRGIQFSKNVVKINKTIHLFFQF